MQRSAKTVLQTCVYRCNWVFPPYNTSTHSFMQGRSRNGVELLKTICVPKQGHAAPSASCCACRCVLCTFRRCAGCACYL
jgi:hypothetical protein